MLNYNSVSSLEGKHCLDISALVRKQQNTARLENVSDVQVLA
jgi:hypothetical protein